MKEYDEGLERQVIELIAADRLDIPISSMSGKLKRMKPKLAQGIILPDNSYAGERVYARIENKDELKARGMRDGVEEFCKQYPKYGKILNGIIEAERTENETHLYFGMNDGKRLTADDYLSVMKNLGFGEVTARSLYNEIIDVSRSISRKRDEERRIMIS